MCHNGAVWALQTHDSKQYTPLCNLHVGEAMEALFKKTGPNFGFGYIRDLSKAKCIWSTQGIGIMLGAEAGIAGVTPVDEKSVGPTIGSKLSVQVFGPGEI